MKVKTKDLKGAALDWVVAQCEGVEIQKPELGQMFVYSSAFGNAYNPSINGSIAVPIIEREKIDLRWLAKQQMWCCYTHQHHIDGFVNGVGFSSETFLLAAMRCYVSKKLGETVDIPKELV